MFFRCRPSRNERIRTNRGGGNRRAAAGAIHTRGTISETEEGIAKAVPPGNAVGRALSIEGVVERVIGYLPSRQRYESCTLVSKLWRRTVVEGGQFPLVLRIEDGATDEGGNSIRDSRHFRGDDGDNDNNSGSCSSSSTHNSGEDTIRYPLHAIGRLPSWVAATTTKLVLVLRFVRKHASEYDLNDFLFYRKRPSWFLDRFGNLRELIVFSEFASDQFVNILSPPTTMLRQPFRIPSLKKIQYEETNLSNWRSSYLRTFVELAPNLEILQVRENMKWKWKEQSAFFRAEDIRELLPLSGSLRELVLFNRPNIHGNFERFLNDMPLLDSWDIHNTFLDLGVCPGTRGRVPQTFEDNAYRRVDLNEHPQLTNYARDEAEFILTMQDVLVLWFLGLDDVNIHPWKNNITHMVGYLDAIMKEYFETNDQFFENRPSRPYRLPTLSNLLEVDTSVASSTGGASFRGGRKHASYCCASRNKTKLKNYCRAVRPCMELYYHEFLYYCDSNSFGVGYSQLQELQQRRELKRFVKRISRVEDQYRKRTVVWFGKASKGKDFSVLV